MSKLTEEQWEELRQFGREHREEIDGIPEELDLKMTRKLMQDPYSIPLMFEAIRRDIKYNIQLLDEMKEKIPRLSSSDELKHSFDLITFFEKSDQKEQADQWNYIEAIALNQIELRKDIGKLLKSIKRTKSNNKIITSLQDKMKKQDMEMSEFKQTKNYIKFTKRFFDERQNHNEND